MCFRRSIIKHINWPLHLGWGSMEDIHLSRELILNGAAFYYDNQNRFYASSKRLGKKNRLGRFSFLKTGYICDIFFIIFFTTIGQNLTTKKSVLMD